MDKLDSKTLSEIYHIAFAPPANAIRNKKRLSKKETDQMETERQLEVMKKTLAMFDQAKSSTDGNGAPTQEAVQPPEEGVQLQQQQQQQQQQIVQVNVENEEEDNSSSS